MALCACVSITFCNSAQGEAPAKRDGGYAGIHRVIPPLTRCLKSFQSRAAQQGSHPRHQVHWGAATDLWLTDRAVSDLSIAMRFAPSWFSRSRLCCSSSSSQLKDKTWSFSYCGKIRHTLVKTV